MNEPNDPPISGVDIQDALRRLYFQSAGDDCPDANDLMDHLLSLLPREQSDQIVRHLEGCPVCTGSLIDLRSAFAPVLDLKRRWWGWRGPLLAARDQLDPRLGRAWNDLCLRHEPSQRRTEAMRRLLRWSPPILSFVSGAAAMALLFLVFRPFALPPHGSGTSGIDNPDVTVTRVPKGADSAGTEDPAQAAFRVSVLPSDEQLPKVIEIWEGIQKQSPRLPGPPAILWQLYTRQYRRERDPARRMFFKVRIEQAAAALQRNTKALQEEIDGKP